MGDDLRLLWWCVAGLGLVAALHGWGCLLLCRHLRRLGWRQDQVEAQLRRHPDPTLAETEMMRRLSRTERAFFKRGY